MLRGFLCSFRKDFIPLNKKWQGSLERNDQVSQVKVWVWGTTGKVWGTLFGQVGWLVWTSMCAEPDQICCWILRDFCFVFCFRASWESQCWCLRKELTCRRSGLCSQHHRLHSSRARGRCSTLASCFAGAFGAHRWVGWSSIAECLRWLTPCCVQFSPPLPTPFLSPLLFFVFTWLASSQALRSRGVRHSAHGGGGQGRSPGSYSINTKYPEQGLFP